MNNVQTNLQAVKHSSQQATSAHETSILAYNGSNITFELSNGEVMVNLTEMAKAFGKRPVEFLRLPSTIELVEAIVRKSHIDEKQVVSTIRGGSNPGTWANRLVALSFAQWLSVDFHLICLEKIEELLTQGVATINNEDETILRAIQVLEQRVQAAQATITLQSEQLKAQAPKVEYTDNVLNSVNTYTSTQMAKELELRTAEQLHKLLKGYGVMIHQSGQWMLSAKYCGQGYTKTRTFSYTRQDGSQGTNNATVWTERGRWFLHQLMVKKGGK